MRADRNSHIRIKADENITINEKREFETAMFWTAILLVLKFGRPNRQERKSIPRTQYNTIQIKVGGGRAGGRMPKTERGEHDEHPRIAGRRLCFRF